MKPEIALISGEYFNFLDPNPDVITLEVIAHALSHVGRYTGHTCRFYSVAEHSLRCWQIDPTPETLLHDASEAFMTDLPTPLKMLMPEYKAMEKNLEQVIAKKFGLPWPMTDATKRADLIMLATEKRDLLPECGEWEVLQGVVPLPGQITTHPVYAEYIREDFLKVAREMGL